jgi:hypothetical protein
MSSGCRYLAGIATSTLSGCGSRRHHSLAGMKALVVLKDHAGRFQAWRKWQFLNGTAAIAVE